MLEEGGVAVTVLARKEVIRRLRDRNEPVLLFAETEIEAFRRLRRLEISEPEINRGLRNDFQEALERVDEAYLNDIIAATKVLPLRLTFLYCYYFKMSQCKGRR